MIFSEEHSQCFRSGTRHDVILWSAHMFRPPPWPPLPGRLDNWELNSLCWRCFCNFILRSHIISVGNISLCIISHKFSYWVLLHSKHSLNKTVLQNKPVPPSLLAWDLWFGVRCLGFGRLTCYQFPSKLLTWFHLNHFKRFKSTNVSQ